MQAKRSRNIQKGTQFDQLFPKPSLSDKHIKKGATVGDTLQFIPKVVKDTLWQTEKIASLLKTDTTYQTCKNIWDFVYNHIRYHKDQTGREQIRSPSRTWHDRKRGVDCDCYTTFISSILTNLGIQHSLRITKYGKDYFQHIYPIVPQKNGNYITIDCVVDQFNYEEPFTQKLDTTMDLEYLDGIDDPEDFDFENEDYYEGEDMGNIFSRIKPPIRRKPPTTSRPRLFPPRNSKSGGGKVINFIKKNNPISVIKNAEGKGFTKVKNIVKAGINLTNKVNPGTIPLRNGFLAAMKLNIFRIAQRMKWAYLSEAEARKMGMDMGKWKRLVKARERMEEIFYHAGGNKENLKKAILGGRGNRNKEVKGLSGYTDLDNDLYTIETPLPQILGDIYYSEMEGLEGTDQLGEVYTAASITAAAGFLAAVSGLIKSIGQVFPRKDQKGAKDFENVDGEDAQAAAMAENPEAVNLDVPETINVDSADSSQDASSDSSSSNSFFNLFSRRTPDPSSTTDTSIADASAPDSDQPQGFWEKNKKWLKPTLIGVGGLGVLYGAYRIYKAKKKLSDPLSGVKSGKAPTKKKTASTAKKKTVKLL